MMEKEKRLIDADALTDKVDESKYNNPHPQGMVRVNHRNEHDHFLRMIMDAPTVDAVEVIHAKWENISGFDFGNCYGCCSNCKTPQKANSVTALYLEHRYCRWCGAKMDGERKDNA